MIILIGSLLFPVPASRAESESRQRTEFRIGDREHNAALELRWVIHHTARQHLRIQPKNSSNLPEFLYQPPRSRVSLGSQRQRVFSGCSYQLPDAALTQRVIVINTNRKDRSGR